MKKLKFRPLMLATLLVLATTTTTASSNPIGGKPAYVYLMWDSDSRSLQLYHRGHGGE